MAEMTFIVDKLTNRILLDDPDHVPAGVVDLLTALLGPAQELGCARPLEILSPPPATAAEIAASVCVRIAGYYHNSLIEGPGRRSTVKLQGCTTRCRGCITPDSWSFRGGTLVPVGRLVQALLDPAFERDGISVVGGEPFAQPEGLWALVQELRARGCRHILVYSGYTYERLRRMARQKPAIDAVLHEIDMLLDGPYVQRLAGGAGPWLGSRNQRVLVLRAGTPTGAVSRNPSP